MKHADQPAANSCSGLKLLANYDCNFGVLFRESR